MTLYEELQARGLVAQITDNEIIDLINNGKATFYIGFDCTADSLTAGHFMALTLMKRLQLFVQSHRNILLFCGAEETKTPSAKHQFGRGREIFAVPPLFAASSQKRPHECTPQSRVTLLRL